MTDRRPPFFTYLDTSRERALEELWALIWSLVHDERLSLVREIQPSDRDDLAQDVFLRLIDDDLRRLRSFKGNSQFRTWLWKIARNRYLDSRRGPRTEQIDAVREIFADEHLENLVSDRLTMEAVLAAASQRLSPEKQLIVAHRLDGHSNKDIASLHPEFGDNKQIGDKYREACEQLRACLTK